MLVKKLSFDLGELKFQKWLWLFNVYGRAVSVRLNSDSQVDKLILE